MNALQYFETSVHSALVLFPSCVPEKMGYESKILKLKKKKITVRNNGTGRVRVYHTNDSPVICGIYMYVLYCYCVTNINIEINKQY